MTITKVILQFLNINLEKIFNPKSVLPDMKSTNYSPIYNYKQELRAPHFDPTTFAFLTILTIDNTTKDVKIVGYSAINLFLNRSDKKQPTNPVDVDVILMKGNYQIPIFCQHPVLLKPFTVDKLLKLDRMPCATLLVRIEQAPMSDDGLKAMSMQDFA